MKAGDGVLRGCNLGKKLLERLVIMGGGEMVLIDRKEDEGKMKVKMKVQMKK